MEEAWHMTLMVPVGAVDCLVVLVGAVAGLEYYYSCSSELSCASDTPSRAWKTKYGPSCLAVNISSTWYSSGLSLPLVAPGLQVNIS